MENKLESKHNFIFWFHLLITLLALAGPFLFSWYLMLIVYSIVLLQFKIFDTCLLNAQHDLTVSDDSTFYSYLLEACGVKVNRPLVKLIVRRYLYFILAGIAVLWQVILGYKALFF